MVLAEISKSRVDGTYSKPAGPRGLTGYIATDSAKTDGETDCSSKHFGV
jgi:hypothetical protein